MKKKHDKVLKLIWVNLVLGNVNCRIIRYKIMITSNSAGDMVWIVKRARPMMPVTACGLQREEQKSAI